MFKRYIPKISLLIITLIISGSCHAFSLFKFENPVFLALKDTIAAQASAMMGREVSIGALEGSLLNFVTLKDVRIAKGKKLSGGAVIKIREARVYYNIFKAAALKDIIPSISRIDLDGPDIYVEHGMDGSWNYEKLMPAGPAGSAPPPFKAKINIRNGKAIFADFIGFGAPLNKRFELSLSKVAGKVDLSKKDKIIYKLSGAMDGSPFSVDGKLDTGSLRSEAKVAAIGLDIGKWNGYLGIPAVKDLDVSGKLSADLDTVAGPETSVKGTVKFSGAKIIGRPFAGLLRIDLKNEKIALSVTEGMLCSGKIKGAAAIDTSVPGASIKGQFVFNSISAGALSGNAAGVKGSASGSIKMSGTGNALDVIADASLSGGAVFGQAADSVSAAANIRNGDMYFKEIRLGSGQTGIKASGSLLKDMSFDLAAEATGFTISNPEIFGGVRGNLEKFTGRINGRFDRSLFEHPFVNLSANGEISLSNAKIGKQAIERISGEVSLEKGLLEIKGLSVAAGASVITVNGSVGIDKPAELKITGKDLQLSDLSALDDLLPEGSKGISGAAAINIGMKGALHESPSVLNALRDMEVSFDAQAVKVSVGGQKVDRAALSFLWKTGEFDIREALVKTPSSTISLSGGMGSGTELGARVSCDLDISDLANFIGKYARAAGRFKAEGNLTGTLASPFLTAKIEAMNASYNSIVIDRIAGNIGYRDGWYTVSGPMVLSRTGEDYEIDARISAGQAQPSYKGSIQTSKGGLRSFTEFLNSVYEELSKIKLQAGDIKKMEVLDPGAIRLPKITQFKAAQGYVLLDPRNGFLKAWAKIRRDTEKKAAASSPEKISADGPLGLAVFFSGEGGDVDVSAGLTAVNGRIGGYVFDRMNISGGFRSSNLYLATFEVKNGGGKLSMSGNASVTGPLKFKISSKDFSIDKLDTALGLGTPLEGKVTVSSAITGTLGSPEVSAAFSMKNAGVAGIYADELHGTVKYSDLSLAVDKLDMTKDGHKASIKGIIPFIPKKQLSLKVNLDGENVGLLASLFKGISWSSGKGKAVLDVGGTLSYPMINGSVSVKNGMINIDQLKSTVYNLSAEVQIKDSVIMVESFTGALSGDRTNKMTDPLSFTGKIDISKAFGRRRVIDTDILIADTSGGINIPGYIASNFELSGARIKGLLYLDGRKEGPGLISVRSDVNLHDGYFMLPQGAGGASGPGLPDIGFDVTADIGKNMRFMQTDNGRVLSVDLTKMDIGIGASDLKIGGSLSSPTILGEIEIRDGNVNILGRDFDVLPKSEQETYFGTDRSMLMKNSVVFKGGKGPQSFYPELMISAKSEVAAMDVRTGSDAPPQFSGATATPSSKDKVMILTRITGVPFVSDKDKALELKFYAFMKDSTKSPPEMTAAPYSENQIRLMLLPDFVKGTLGISSGGGLDTNAVVVDYLNARLQSYLLKGITGQLEKALGLESLTLNYNFGRDLEKLLPTRRGEYAYNDTAQLGVGFVKGFFDKVFIQLRYAQAMDQNTTSINSLNYQITWKANKDYSLVYYREPITFQDQNSTYYKLMLQSQYMF